MKTPIKLLTTAMLWLVVMTCVNAQPTDNVIAYYPFNGNANDVTGNGYNASSTSATLTTDRLGKANAAYFFDGKSNVIKLPKTILTNSTSFAISFWIKPAGNHTTTDASQQLVDLRGQYYIQIPYFQPSSTSVPNSVWFATMDGTSTRTQLMSNNGAVPVNQWTHIVATYCNNIQQLYLNGALVKSASAQPASAASNVNNTLGKDVSTANQGWFYGVMDEVIIYKRGLTSTEVQSLYNRGLTSSEIPELYYKPNIQYTYDAIGRRTSRNVIVLKSASYISTKDSVGLEQAFVPGETYEENLGNQKVIIYPNPTQGQLLVEIQGYEKETNTALYLFDLSGKLLISRKPANSTMPLDLSGYSVGTYVLKIVLGDKTSEWKIMKE